MLTADGPSAPRGVIVYCFGGSVPRRDGHRARPVAAETKACARFSRTMRARYIGTGADNIAAETCRHYTASMAPRPNCLAGARALMSASRA